MTNLINLAGNQNADTYIRSELTRCGIEVVEVEKGNTEVPYSLIGRLGDLKFRRAWYYWVVEGDVPLDIARKLYDHPIGRTDIRVAGHCACPSPEEWVKWKNMEGKELISQKEVHEIQEMISRSKSETSITFYKKWLEDVEILENTPEDQRVGIISPYHIDSELGLYIFVQMLQGKLT